jgi:hypothetical protein
MKRAIAVLMCLILILLPVAGSAEKAAFDTNLGWNVFAYDGNSFRIREDGLYTPQSTNTVFVRSDKYVDGTTSFTMEYEVDILSMVDNDYVWNEGWLYYTFSFGMPSEEETPYDELIKNRLFTHGGLTMLPKTSEGVYLEAGTAEQMPEALCGDVKHLTVKIEYAKSTEVFTFTVNGLELYSDYFEPEYHEGYIGIETAWTEMLVTKAIYTEYPEGLPSEKKATAEPQPTDAPEVTEAPQEPTDPPAATEIISDNATDAPAKNDKKGDISPIVWIVAALACAAVIGVVTTLIARKNKK